VIRGQTYRSAPPIQPTQSIMLVSEKFAGIRRLVETRRLDLNFFKTSSTKFRGTLSIRVLTSTQLRPRSMGSFAAPLSVPANHRSPPRRVRRDSHYNVLFLCTGNSARSIMAEAILNLKGRQTFHAYSAGSHPAGVVRSEALRHLEVAHIPIDGLRSKSWDEFAIPGAQQMNFVFTVCDNAAQEACPIWPGQPITAHLGSS
jgi:protein-tyrosine-phosphatase